MSEEQAPAAGEDHRTWWPDVILEMAKDAAPRPIYFSPLRNSLVIREAYAQEAAAKRRAEEQDRREWTEGIRRRLGLVAEVHRVRVWKRGEGDWAARCLRPGCPTGTGVGWAPSQQYALGDALAHAGAFLPLPPEEEPFTELDLLAFDAAWARMRAQQDAFAAALPERVAAVAGEINSGLHEAGLMPEGMRFEWAADGE